MVPATACATVHRGWRHISMCVYPPSSQRPLLASSPCSASFRLAGLPGRHIFMPRRGCQRCDLYYLPISGCCLQVQPRTFTHAHSILMWRPIRLCEQTPSQRNGTAQLRRGTMPRSRWAAGFQGMLQTCSAIAHQLGSYPGRILVVEEPCTKWPACKVPSAG